jgi:hypothetical protein
MALEARKKKLIAWLGAPLMVLGGSALMSAQEAPAPQRAEVPADAGGIDAGIVHFMTANCVMCHGPTRQSGDLDLSGYTTTASIKEHRDEWDLVLERIEAGEMPPKTMSARNMPPGGLPNPSADDRQAAIAAIKGELENADHAVKPMAGRVSARRLNRAEYNNTVQDLLGVKVWPASDFPQDDAAYGFDNIADALNLSPVLMEKYMDAAEKVARTAVFGPEKMPPAVKKLEQLEREVTNITEVPKEYDESGLTTDRAMHAIHRFPVDGVYLFRVTARGFRPLGSEPLELGLWLDGKLVTELHVDPKEDGPSLLGGRQDLFGKPQEYKMFVPAGDHWVAATVLRIYEGLPPVYKGPHPSTRPSATQPVEFALQGAEREKLEAEAAAQNGANAPASGRGEAGSPSGLPVGVAPPASQPAPAIAAAIPASQPAVENAAPASQPAFANGRRGGRGRGGRGRGGFGRGPRLAPIETQVGIDYVDVVGPIEQVAGPSQESLRRIYPRPNMDRSDPNTPREILTGIVRRAFRRPVAAADVDPYVNLFSQVRGGGDSFEEALAVAIQGILVSPDFLLRIERDPTQESAQENVQITDHELATRLSYFLWSTMPDDELSALADAGKLHEPAILEAQVRRMLASPRAHALAENFGGQWLRFRALESVTPDFNLFPEYDAYLQISMKEETERFFDYVVHDDRSILDFIDGKYTFLNEKLAMLYGIPGVKGPEFRKVDLTGTPRGGVITQASVLTVSSYATRTSPVLRGKWILENILNAPPPPPPNNVPALEETIKNNPNATLRQQMEIHRSNPACAGCHARMDPLGMGLENFNAIGAWRTADGTLPVDASGKLPDGRSFNGPDELLAVIAQDREAFTECVAEKLLTYAIGRGLESYDKATVRQIVANVAKKDYRFSSLVMEIVNSLPFQKRSSGSRS